MDKIDVFFIFVLKTIYSTLPAIGANVAPILTKKVPFLKFPLDFNLTFKGERILGDHKTFRGLVSGVLFSMLIISIQYLIFRFTKFDFTLYNHSTTNFLALGFLMGLGVIAGDAVKSFIKRRFKVSPGESFIPWDQIDCVLGGLLFGRLVWKFEISYGLVIIFLTFFLHILIRHIAFYLGLCESKW